LGPTIYFEVFGGFVALLGLSIAIFRRSVTRFLQIYYGLKRSAWGDWIASRISVWSTMVLAAELFAFGCLMMFMAVRVSMLAG